MSLTNTRFKTTRWSDLKALATDRESDRRELLNALAARYWPPVYAHLRGLGLPPAQAADLTQDFFTTVVLGRKLFERAREHRGRLRSLLLTALGNFRIDHIRREHKHREVVSFEACDFAAEESTLQTIIEPASASVAIFDQRWALGLLNEAVDRCRRHFCTNDRHGHWRLFELRVLEPASSGNRPPPMAEIYESAGFRNSALAVAAVQVVKKRLAAVLREVVRETVDDEEFEDEYAMIRGFIGSDGRRF